MYSLVLSYHYKKPEILDSKSCKSKELRLIADVTGQGFYVVFHSSDRNKCITAWNNIQIACDKQSKHFNLN